MTDCKASTKRMGQGSNPRRRAAFSLIEMLVVVGIIGVLASIGLPAMKGLMRPQAKSAASRQLVDDFGLARAAARSTRSTVYVVFVPPNVWQYAQNPAVYGFSATNNLTLLTNLVSGQFTTYAIYAKRTAGDQPGQPRTRYLTDWRSLPDGIFVATNAFYDTNLFSVEAIPFPTSDSPPISLPYVAFNALGQLISGRDAVVPLAEGSILLEKNLDGSFKPVAADVLELPPGNSTNNYQHVRVNWLTGRAKSERQEIQ